MEEEGVEVNNGIIFNDDFVESYRSDPRINDALGGYILLNKSDFLSWMGPEAIREMPPRKVKSRKSAELGRTAEKNVTEEKYLGVLQRLASEVCVGIVEDYAESQMDNIINDIENFDILVAVSDDYETVNKFQYTENLTEKKMDKVVGFIITELGECVKLPNAVSVKLICVRRGTVKGSLLMGAYLGAIQHSNYDKIGILELARGYLNAPGFISYAKMGYRKDITLYGEDCFSDFKNLPMSVDLNRFHTEQIIDIAIERYQIDEGEVGDPTGIFPLYKRGIKQIPPDLLACNNLLLKAELNREELIDAIEECELDPDECKLKPDELELLKTQGFSDVNESNIAHFVEHLKSLRDQRVDEILSKKGGSKKKKTRRKKKTTRKKKSTRRRFTKKSKK